MPRARVLIEISPTRVDVHHVERDRVSGTRSQGVELAAEAEGWAESLAQVTPVVARLLAEMKLARPLATVVYAGPTRGSTVLACPRTAGRSGAIQAALLGVGEAADLNPAEHPHDVRVLASDGASPSSDAGDTPPLPQMHALVSVERQEIASGIASAVSRAGVDVEHIVCADAVAMAGAVAAALEAAKGSGTILAVFVGDTGSILAAADGSCLRFVRPMGVGVETLVRAIMPAPGRTSTAPRDYASAERHLLECGIPRRDEARTPGVATPADSILPLVQPAIQRAVIEIRQSLRFGLADAPRAAGRLLVCGPGAAIPRFAAVLAEQVGLALHAAPGAAAQASASGRTTLAATYLDHADRIPALLPAELRRVATMERARRGLLIGTGLAIAWVAAEAWSVRADLADARANAARIRAEAEATRPIVEMHGALERSRRALDEASARLRERLAVAPPWDAVLAMLSQVTPPGVRFGTVSMSIDGGTPVIRLQGRTVMPERYDSQATLKAFLDAVSQTPLVRGARLGSTQRSETPWGVQQSFELTVELVGTPGSIAAAAAGDGGATP